MNINDWNNIEKTTDDVNVIAEEGDLTVEIGGVAYLLQRKNDINNVICLRVKDSKMPLMDSFKVFRKWLISEGIQYICVCGNLRRYNCLTKLKGLDGYKALKDKSETKQNVFYIKLF